MKNKDLIIDLIQQDLKHNQLIASLQKIGLEAREQHCLGILEIVAKLMKVPEGKVDDLWGAAYASFMGQVGCYDMDGNSLRLLAEVCYRQLKTILDDESRCSFCLDAKSTKEIHEFL